LNNLAELIAKLGSLAGLLLFIALLIRFFVQLGTGDPHRQVQSNCMTMICSYSSYSTATEKGIAFVNILIIAVTLIVVAVPEGQALLSDLVLTD
jgi:P-type Ca2+ transporter type 2C